MLTLTMQRWWWSRREMRQTRDRSAQAVAEAARRIAEAQRLNGPAGWIGA